ncbi:MAG: DNA polymerase III subunit epsilon [Alphaproteobacteria bacterium]
MSKMERQIVLDTETTGLDPKQGDRIVEIGALEIVDLIPTGSTFQVYVDPERPMSEGATKITGITDAKLKGCPKFHEIAQDFLSFIGDAKLVIHNAPFDIGFLNAEFMRLDIPGLNAERVVDTLTIARKKFPGQQNNLDALCRRLGVDNTSRTVHGALLDSELLAEVYAELLGGRQRGLGLGDDGAGVGASELAAVALSADLRPSGIQRPARAHAPSEEELEAHTTFLKTRVTNAIWNRD